MRKLAKLSLVAAVAVAGLTNVNAASLEEAIKGVDVSGKVYVETLANTVKNAETLTTTDIDADITFKSKVNDNITAVVRVQADIEDSEGTSAGQDVTVDNVYFTYANAGLTVNAGKQDINTPNTDGELGTGALASYDAGVASIVAAHYYDNAITSNTISAAAVLGSVGQVNAELWYINASGHSDNYTLAASTKLGPVSLAARHAMTSYDDATKKDGSTTRIDASASISGFGLKATYLTTDKDNSAFVTDASSANTYELSQLGLKNEADVDLYAVGASYTMNSLTYAVDYASYDQGTNGDADELRFRATYKMSKNFTVMGTYSMYEGENLTTTTNNKESDSARLEAKYTF